MSDNCALAIRGCIIVQQSAPSNASCSAQRILYDYDAKLQHSQRNWVAPIQPHPYCLINIGQVQHRPCMLNTIGFYSNTCSASSPYLIQVYYKQKICEKWSMLGEFELQKYAGWQRFTFQSINYAKMPYVYFKITDNFGGKEVKLTQISLGYIQKDDKVYELQEEVSILRIENIKLRQRMEKQETTLTEIKSSVKSLEEQIKAMKIDTESQSSDEFSKLNYSMESEEKYITNKTREIIITEDEKTAITSIFEVL